MVPQSDFDVFNVALKAQSFTKDFAVGLAVTRDAQLLDTWAMDSEDYWSRIGAKNKFATVQTQVAVYKNGLLIGCASVKSARNNLFIERIDADPACTSYEHLMVVQVVRAFVRCVDRWHGHAYLIVFRDIQTKNWAFYKALKLSCVKTGHCNSGCDCSQTVDPKPYLNFYVV